MSHMRSGWHTGAGVREDRGENLSLSTAAGKGEEKEEEEEVVVVVKGEVDGDQTRTCGERWSCKAVESHHQHWHRRLWIPCAETLEEPWRVQPVVCSLYNGHKWFSPEQHLVGL